MQEKCEFCTLQGPQGPVTTSSWMKDIQQAEFQAFQTLALNRSLIHCRNAVECEFQADPSLKPYYLAPQATKHALKPEI